jgi:hypothetical protein
MLAQLVLPNQTNKRPVTCRLLIIIFAIELHKESLAVPELQAYKFLALCGETALLLFLYYEPPGFRMQ